jgi:hypothetical protein
MSSQADATSRSTVCQRWSRGKVVCKCLLLLALGSACGTDDRAAKLDRMAEQYVRLALALDRWDPDFVDSYVGPRQWATDAAKQNWSIDRIVEESAALRNGLGRAYGDASRRAFLLAQTAAIERRARRIRGESADMREEAAQYGLTVPAFEPARAAQLRNDLSAAARGADALPTRLLRIHAAARVPRARLDQVIRRAIDECQRRTARHWQLPANQLDVRYVTDRQWLVYTTYQGHGTSLIEFRRDVPITVHDVVTLACHEAFPGHHLQYVTWDTELRIARQLPEFSVTPLFTPQGVMAERLAAAAPGIAFTHDERRAFEEGVLASLAGIEASSVSAFTRVSDLFDELTALALPIAAEYADGRLSEADAASRLRDELLMPQPIPFLRFVARYRAYAAAYVASTTIAPDWTSYRGTLLSPLRLVSGASR